MESEHFHDFMMYLGATPGRFIQTPFPLYFIDSHQVLFHYIDLEIYRTVRPGNEFLKDCFYEAKNKGLKIITVWEDVWRSRNRLVKARIKALINTRQRIHARQTQVTRIDKEAADSFLNTNHLQGSTSAYYKFALLYNNEPVAVATFSKARTMYDGPVYYRSYELERFASKQGVTIPGGLGKLLSHFIGLSHAKHIMTYADADWGSGEGYLKLGFQCVEHSLPVKFVVNERYAVRKHAGASQDIPQDPDVLAVANTGSLKFVLAT